MGSLTTAYIPCILPMVQSHTKCLTSKSTGLRLFSANTITKLVIPPQSTLTTTTTATRRWIAITMNLTSLPTRNFNSLPPSTMDEDISSLKRSYPGRTALINTISTLLFARSPSFVHLHDPSTFQQTRTLLSDILLAVTRHSPATIYAAVDCALCFTPKLLFTSTLNGLAKFEPSWSNGCKTWSCEDINLSDGLDGFLHGLQNLLGGRMPSRTTQKERSAVIVFVNPESMRHSQQNMVTTMTRLRELVRSTRSARLYPFDYVPRPAVPSRPFFCQN